MMGNNLCVTLATSTISGSVYSVTNAKERGILPVFVRALQMLEEIKRLVRNLEMEVERYVMSVEIRGTSSGIFLNWRTNE